MRQHLSLLHALGLAVILSLPGFAQKSDDKNFDLRSSAGDLHIGNDADARKAGLPLYPGARLKADDYDNSGKVNLGILTEAFGMKLVVVRYESDDAPARVLDFYRAKLKQYGKVLECHSEKHGGDFDVENDDKGTNPDKKLKCDENSGPVTELKVGTEDDQHIVAVEPGDSGKGTSFALVYVNTKNKRGEI